MKKHFLFLFTVILSIFFCESPALAKVLYVDADAPGANNGTNWENAYNFLQDAMADASSSEKPVSIRIAQGIYTPDRSTVVPQGTGDRNATFQLISGVSLIGGYAGYGERDPSIKAVDLYDTILSGDLNGDDSLNSFNNGENSYHVITGNDADSTCLLEGVTITAGNANGVTADSKRGGGMFNRGGLPALIECAFIHNVSGIESGMTPADGGGGVFNTLGNPSFIRCSFRNNSSGRDGGGMFNIDTHLVLKECIFEDNSAVHGGGSIYNSGSWLDINNCVFRGNSAQRGGGIRNWTSSPLITLCVFIGNWVETRGTGATDGGGIANNVRSNPIITNCSFINNTSQLSGGGISNMNSHPTIINCTFSGNKAVWLKGGGVYGGATIINSILWGDQPDEIDSASSAEVSFSNIHGGYEGVGNIDIDPLFADPVSGDYRLKSQAGRYEATSHTWVIDDITSPSIDAGDPMFPLGHEPFPNGGVINMGAYGGTAEASKSYFGKPLCETIVAGDINGDCNVDLLDFALMALHWCDNYNL